VIFDLNFFIAYNQIVLPKFSS